MKNKKGFVFVETLIVVAVLTASLLILYSTYSSIIVKEKNRIKYNDPTYLYRTFYLKKFFNSFSLNYLTNNSDVLNKEKNYITAVSCPQILMNDVNNLGFCESLIREFHVRNIFLTYSDLTPLQNCYDNSGVCSSLLSLGDRQGKTAEFIKTIGKEENDGYRLIIEFAEAKDGSYCTDTESNCDSYYYATLILNGGE